MKCKFKNRVSLKSGGFIAKGTIADVVPTTNTKARITLSDGRVWSASIEFLYNWFDEFIEITDNMVESAMFDSVVESVTGERIEPDGHDSNGFPSILLAVGLM